LGVDSRRARAGSGISEMDGSGEGKNGGVSRESLPGSGEGGERGFGERGSYTSWQTLSPRSR
jgi:hypothetical protein